MKINRFILKNQNGFAMFVAIMMLSLGSSFAFLAFQVSTTELAISRYSADEASVQYLAESGIAKILSWATSPAASPKPSFFDGLSLTARCTGTQANPDFPNAADLPVPPDFLDPASGGGPFDDLKNVGKIVDLRLYAPVHPKGICTVEVIAETATGASTKLRVEITQNPLQAITAAMQGAGNPAVASPGWAHWGKIRYTGSAQLGNDIKKVPNLDNIALPTSNPYFDDPSDYPLNIDPLMVVNVESTITNPPPDNGNTYTDRPNVRQNVATVSLDEIDLDRLRSFIKKNAEYYTVSTDEQQLVKNGHEIGTFDEVFDPQPGDPLYGLHTGHRLVWVENAGRPPLEIYRGHFHGYYYFSGSVSIHGDVAGMDVNAVSPPVPPSTQGLPFLLTDINLEGLIYTQEQIEIHNDFSIYGSIYSENGFTGTGATDLEVWYNADFAQSRYSGVRRVTPLAGTWVTVPLDVP